MAHSIEITLDMDKLRTSSVTEIWKWGQANKDDNNYQKIYHLQYGEGDNPDVELMKLYLRQRINSLSDILSEYLTDIVFGTNVTPVDVNNPTQSPFLPARRETEADYAVFSLTLPGGWNPNTHGNLVRLMEGYVTDGAASDWFVNTGMEQGAVYAQRAAEHKNGIINNIYHKNTTI